jgi:hypothetical protein
VDDCHHARDRLERSNRVGGLVGGGDERDCSVVPSREALEECTTEAGVTRDHCGDRVGTC